MTNSVLHDAQNASSAMQDAEIPRNDDNIVFVSDAVTAARCAELIDAAPRRQDDRTVLAAGLDGVELILIDPDLPDEVATELLQKVWTARLATPIAIGHTDPTKSKGSTTDQPNAEDQDRRNDNRRDTERCRTLKTGQLIYNNLSCVLDCMVLDVTEGGAKVQVADNLDLPKDVRLDIQFGMSRNCEICWRDGDKIGLRFVD